MAKHARYRITPKRAGVVYVTEYRKTMVGARKAARRALEDRVLPATSVVIEGTDGTPSSHWRWGNAYQWEEVAVLKRKT